MDRCPTCAFAFDAPEDELLDIVRTAESRYRRLLVDRPPAALATAPSAQRWPAVAYQWHVVDVLRLGADRLWALVLDPGVAIVPWDADELAAARRYHALGPHTGLRGLGRAAESWHEAYAACPPEAVAHHPELGPMTRAVLASRNAHEVVHHARDLTDDLTDDLAAGRTPGGGA